MRRIILLGCFILFSSAMAFAQEKIGAPVWNVGDKWVFYKEGPMEVVGIDKNGYIVEFSGGIFLKSLTGTAIFDKSTLNILYFLKDNKPRKYKGARRRIFNFPQTIGKQWEDSYSRKPGGWIIDFSENFLVMGWEGVEVRAGKFKTIKLEYKLEITGPLGSFWVPVIGPIGRVWYWYSPEVKNFVRCQHEKGYREGPDELGEREDWELISFQLKK
jgi:hypothetical protein